MFDEIYENFAKNLYNLRKYTRRTQNEVAKRTNLTQGYVSQLELGNTRPSNETMISIAKSFNVSVRQLTGLDPIQWVKVW